MNPDKRRERKLAKRETRGCLYEPYQAGRLNEDHVAACLLLDGEPQKPCVTENAKTYAVEWQMQYRFNGDEFVLLDPQGQTFVFSDYPVDEIQHQIENYVRLNSELNE